MRCDVDRDDGRRRALRRGDEGGATGIARDTLRIGGSRRALRRGAFVATCAPEVVIAIPVSLGREPRHPMAVARARTVLHAAREGMGLLVGGLGEQLRRVRSRNEIEPVRRCRWARVLIIPAREKPSDVPNRAAFRSHVHHRADHHSHHMVEEPIRLDMKAHTTSVRPFRPFGERKGAAVMRFRRALGGEGGEVMLAEELARRELKRCDVERSAQRPLEPAPEWRCGCGVESEVVAIATGNRALPRVKAGPHLMHRLDPAIAGEQRVESAVKIERRPMDGASKLTPMPWA